MLAGEAARRGLDRDLEVRDETKGALVRRYLALGFEPTVTSADVPDKLVRREYQRRLATVAMEQIKGEFQETTWRAFRLTAG